MLPSFDNSKYPRIITGLVAGMILGAVTLVASVLSVTISQFDFPAPHFVLRAVTSSLHNDDVIELEEPADNRLNCLLADQFPTDPTVNVYLKELLTIKLRKLDLLKKRRRSKQRRQLNVLAWQRVETCFNVSAATGYLIATVYFTVICLIQ